MKILIVYTLNSLLLTLKAHNHKMYVFCRPIKYLKPHRQTVWVHNVCLYVYVKWTFSDAVILLTFLGLINVLCVYTEIMAQDDTVTFK